MTKLWEYIYRNSVETPEKTAVVCDNHSLSYRELFQSIKERSDKLCSDERKAIVVKSSQSIDFIISYFAVQKAGKAIVPLEKDTPDKRFREIEQLIEINDIPDDVSDILFTTGTTGQQKGTMLSHKAVVSNAENLICSQGFNKETVFVISGPLNHIGSLSKIWPVMIVGGTIIITDGIKDINAFFNALDYNSTKLATFLVPTSLRILLQLGKERISKYSDKIDFIETGAAPISQSDMETLCKILPNTRLYNTYASTETGIIATHDFCHDDCIAGCLGRTMKHATIVITEGGTIACKGPMLMTGYIGDKELTEKIKHDDTVFTSDIGHMDEKGRLLLDGRKDDVINIGGYKISPSEVENAAMAYAGISDCICISKAGHVLGNVLALLYVPKNDYDFNRKDLINHLKKNLESYKIPLMYSQVDKIERTYNGKINRKFYKTE